MSNKNMVEEIIAFNKQFVRARIRKYITNKYPDKACHSFLYGYPFDKLLPAALGLRNGDAKIKMPVPLFPSFRQCDP